MASTRLINTAILYMLQCCTCCPLVAVVCLLRSRLLGHGVPKKSRTLYAWSQSCFFIIPSSRLTLCAEGQKGKDMLHALECESERRRGSNDNKHISQTAVNVRLSWRAKHCSSVVGSSHQVNVILSPLEDADQSSTVELDSDT